MSEICQKCKEEDEDRRTLWMACFYEMNELGLPFQKKTIIEGGINDDPMNKKHHFYTLRVCKSCRSGWMHAIKDWFESSKIIDSCESGIFVRDFGKNVEITREEWDMRIKDMDK